MAVKKRMALYVQEFIVQGSGRFPLDMLRYDAAHPATGADASRMEWDPGRTPDPRRVLLRRYTTGGQPGIERWDSFGWRVVEVDGKLL